MPFHLMIFGIAVCLLSLSEMLPERKHIYTYRY